VTEYRHAGNYREITLWDVLCVILKYICLNNKNNNKTQIEGPKGKGRGRNAMNECVKVDMKRYGLVRDDAHNRDPVQEFDTWRLPHTASVG